MTVVVNLPQESRRQRKKAAVRMRIISAGIQLFSRDGMANVTVEQIAETADIGKGTIYNYFQTKEDIVVAFMADLERRVQGKMERMPPSSGSLESILVEFVRLQFRMKKPYHKFVRVFLGQMFLHTEAFLPYMVEMQKAIDPPMAKLFERLQRRGLLRKDVSVPELVLMFKTIHLGLTAIWAVEGPPFRTTDLILRQEINLLCEGLKGETA